MADLAFSSANERPIRTGAVSDTLVDLIRATLPQPGETTSTRSVTIDVTGKDGKAVKRVMANLSALGRTGRVDARVRTTHVPEEAKVYAWAEPKDTPKPKAKRKKKAAAGEPAPPTEVVTEPAAEPAAEPVAAE